MNSRKIKKISLSLHNEIIKRLTAHEQGYTKTYTRKEAKKLLQEHLSSIYAKK